MITQVRTAAVHDGKLPEAVEFGLKVVAYISDKFPDLNIQLIRNVGGPIYELHWVSSTETLATYEEVNKSIEADEGYQALVAEARQARVFVASSLVDRLYETISG